MTVLVMNDPGGLIETATFCKQNDEKRPTLVGLPDFSTVQLCDDDLTLPAGSRSPDPNDPTGKATIFTADTVHDALATSWYIRLQFDELLDPDVEELLPETEDADGDPATPETPTGRFSGSLLNTQPVALKCTAPGSTTAVAVDYDGYYSPSGNAFTWPVGPSLFISPVDHSAIATGSTCTVEILDKVVDKNGNPVPGDQRGNGGTYTWDVEPLVFLESAPAPAAPGEEEVITPDSPLTLSFNAFIDAASLAPGEVTIKEGADCAAAAAGTAKTAVVSQLDEFTIGINIAGVVQTNCTGCVWNPMKAYVVEFSADNAVADLAGGPGALPGAADFSLCFLTDAAP